MGKIYTKTGDKGTTSLVGGSRVVKHHAQVEAYGTIDELNSSIGITLAELAKSSSHQPYYQILCTVQEQLFSIGGIVATEVKLWNKEEVHKQLKNFVIFLEKKIDEISKELAPLTSFILPRGSMIIAFLHQNRTICRKTERKISLLLENNNDYFYVLQYFNRLADFFFIFARLFHKIENVSESYWKSDK